ncbi:hypothetical protein K7X08_030152 [Anisodus acutangulus]|uniref:Secreted protein n=1 Tax=Anisodus acutangulus TaxID=402998 RepID=A0A9Q1R343_9SOLA|nr:hypothetical protein K7X08_030152 [Anisodus acutangulus]
MFGSITVLTPFFLLFPFPFPSLEHFSDDAVNWSPEVATLTRRKFRRHRKLLHLFRFLAYTHSVSNLKLSRIAFI